jgi:hypothetical protein
MYLEIIMVAFSKVQLSKTMIRLKTGLLCIRCIAIIGHAFGEAYSRFGYT